jgi:hypothetical protein
MAEVKTKISLDLAQLQRDLETFVGSNRDLFDAVQDVSRAYDDQNDKQRQLARGRQRALRDLKDEWAASHKDVKEKIVDIDQVWGKFTDKLKETRFIGPAAEALPQQLSGARNAFSQFRTTMLAELPFGGIIGLMVLGGKREEEIRAMTTSAMRTFQQAGQVGRGELTQLSGRIRSLGVQIGKGPTGLMGEFEAAGASFAQFGVSSSEALSKGFMSPLRGVNETVLETSVRLDSLFKQGAGTAARQMGQVIKDFGVNTSESARIIASVGLAARDSGTSVQAFTSSVMRSAAALRTQRVDITEVAEAQLKFQKIMERDLGARPQFAAGFAERGIAQVTQGLAGMSAGLSAVIGERILARRPELQREGEPLTGLAARRAMRLGFQGGQAPEGQREFFAESIREITRLAREAAPDPAGQRYFLERQGFGFEGAEALMAISEETSTTNDINKAIENHQKELKRAFVDRGAEQSGYLKAIMDAQDGIAKVGAGLLTAVISGFQGVFNMAQALWAKYVTKDQQEAEYRFAQMEAISKRSTSAFDLIAKGAKQIGTGGEEFAETLLGRHGERGISKEQWLREDPSRRDLPTGEDVSPADIVLPGGAMSRRAGGKAYREAAKYLEEAAFGPEAGQGEPIPKEEILRAREARRKTRAVAEGFEEGEEIEVIRVTKKASRKVPVNKGVSD